MPDQIRFPYGDAFIVNTPYLDKLSNDLYQQQRQKELYQQQQNKALDDEFARNLTGVRDADIPELTKAYGEFKQARMGTINKHRVPPEMQLDVLKKKAGIYDVINKSKTQKEWEQAQGKQIMTDKKGMYADDAHQQLIGRMRTPVSQIDFNNDSKLLYPYSMPDLSKELKTARGDEKEVPITLGQSKTDPFKDDKEIYKAGNNPNQFFSNLVQGVMASNKTRNFAGIVNNKYTDEELQDLQNKYYAKVNDPKFIAVYGKVAPFPDVATTTDLGKAAAIETMEEFVNKDLKPTKLVSEVNVGRKTADAQDFAMKKMYAQHKLTQDNIRLAAGLRKDAKTDGVVESADSVLHNVYDIVNEAKKVSQEAAGLSKGTILQGALGNLPIKISDPNLFKTFSNIVKDGTTPIPPDDVYFDEKKDQFNLTYKMSDGTIKEVPVSARDYLKLKAKETYTGTEAGKIIDIIDKVVTKNGGLTNTLKMYEPKPEQESTPIELKSGVLKAGDLKKGQLYIRNGKKFIWDGEKPIIQ